MRSAECRRIGRDLHQGILQDLTLAGFRLRTMQTAADGETAAVAIADFASWLRDRQADLRRYVSDLEAGGPAADIANLASELEESCGCRVTIHPQIETASPEIRGRLVATLRGAVPLVAAGTGATRIDIGYESDPLALLRVVHNGRGMTTDKDTLAKLQSAIGDDGATLHIQSAETLLIGWVG